MSADTVPMQPALSPELSSEDVARADCYALLARLFYAGPEAGLLHAISAAPNQGADDAETAISMTWRALAEAAARADAVAVQQEHDLVFVGTGKAEITPYASFYLAETGRERLLARLRGDLLSLGLARAESIGEPEDHFASLFDVMRHLVSAGADDASLGRQRKFFEQYIGPAFGAFCNATIASANTAFYKDVARFAKAFMEVESEALKMV